MSYEPQEVNPDEAAAAQASVDQLHARAVDVLRGSRMWALFFSPDADGAAAELIAGGSGEAGDVGAFVEAVLRGAAYVASNFGVDIQATLDRVLEDGVRDGQVDIWFQPDEDDRVE